MPRQALRRAHLPDGRMRLRNHPQALIRHRPQVRQRVRARRRAVHHRDAIRTQLQGVMPALQQRVTQHTAGGPTTTSGDEHPQQTHRCSPTRAAAVNRATCGVRGGSTPRTARHFRPASAPQNEHGTDNRPTDPSSRRAASNSASSRATLAFNQRVDPPATASCSDKCATPRRNEAASTGRNDRAARSTNTISCSGDGNGP